jgi:hypothetical protein
MNALTSAKTADAGPPDFSLALDYAGLTALVESALNAVNAADLDALEARMGESVVFRMGKTALPFTTANFFLSFSIPNFYFHATTGYDLLRAKGVKLGKMDFLGNMRVGV